MELLLKNSLLQNCIELKYEHWVNVFYVKTAVEDQTH